jgi:hypothetical protein
MSSYPTARPSAPPVTEAVDTYLRQSRGARWTAFDDDLRRPATPIDVHDLWDHLGDFA